MRGLPESLGELPVAALAEEIDTPGEGQIRALVTIAGNPVLSTPNADRLDAALGQLEFMVSVDIYVNETTRHADVILPVAERRCRSRTTTWPCCQLALRNVANWSEPVLPLDDGQPDEWEVLAKLALIAQGMGPDADPAIVDDLTYRRARRSTRPTSVARRRDRRRPGGAGPARDRRPHAAHRSLRARPSTTCSANPHGIDLGAARAPASPRCCARRAAASSWRRR